MLREVPQTEDKYGYGDYANDPLKESSPCTQAVSLIHAVKVPNDCVELVGTFEFYHGK